ncbi:hypothetical protein AX17_000646 [Amanita inopinata Kibby_2008]|nr:hypothetical protein AX17_000646 [Amanita inopinata Kibby_2008]
MSENAGRPTFQHSKGLRHPLRLAIYLSFSLKHQYPALFQVKARIRQAVFQGLSDPDRRIRSLCAHTLSSVADCDWPDEYPDLLSSLISLLSSGSPNSVHGAMQVFTEFIKSDLTEDQILPVLRQLLPVLLNILGSAESHSAPTRARTVSVFRQCVTALFMVKDQHPQAVKEAVASVLPVWLDAFKVLLNQDVEQEVRRSDNWDGLSIRIQVFKNAKTLDTIHTCFPRALTPYLQEFLFFSLHHLQILYPCFVRYYISPSDSMPRTSEDEAVELPQLICPIIDFVSAVARSGKARAWFDGNHFSPLVASVFGFTQMTDEDEETWGTSPNAFIAQEEDETLAYSVRVAGFDLLGCLIDRNPAQTVEAFQFALERVIQGSEMERNAGHPNWWRPLEAALASIGSQAESILDFLEDEQDSGRPKPINIETLLTNVIPSVLNLPDVPFLQGRGFVFASQFSRLLSIQDAVQYLEAAIHVIEAAAASIPVKVSAVKAIHNFCQERKDSSLEPFATRIAKDLGPFLLTTSDDTLLLVLETVSSVLEIEDAKWLDAELASSLVQAVLQVWNKNIKDPIFLSILTDILTSLASSQSAGVYDTTIKQALPTLTDAMTSAKPEESWITSSAIELISSLVKGSGNGLAQGFFSHIAAGLFKCLREAEDRDVLQNGIECLTVIIRKDSNQLVAWHDENGRSGLEYVLIFIARILESPDESGGLVLGDLIIHLLRKTGESVLPVLPQLLQSMVKRMVTAGTATFIQSLVIPFAFLINNQRDTVLNLLESSQVENRSALDVLINTWCENAETFQGFWPSRISTLALSQLFTAERPTLENLMVKGDIIVKPETQNAPHEFTFVTFPVKALKILVREVLSGGDSATITAQGGDTFDAESDDGDEEWTEEERLNQGFKKDELDFLSDMIGPKGVTFDNDDILDEYDDEELKNDPVCQIDIQTHLATFIKECATRNTNRFSSVVDQLNAEEALVIRQIVQG